MKDVPAAGGVPVSFVLLDAGSPVLGAMVARNGHTAASYSNDHRLRVFDARSGAVQRTIDLQGRVAAMTAISDDGRLVLLGDYDGRVTVWNIDSAGAPWQFEHQRYLTAAAFSRDASLLAIAPGFGVQIYDSVGHRLMRELASTSGTSAVVFSRDRRRLGTSDGDGVHVYDVASGRQLAHSDDFVAEPLAVDLTPDGGRLIAGGGDGSVILIDAATGRMLRRSSKYTDPVMYVEVSPDGHEVAIVTQPADNPFVPAPVIIADAETLATKTVATPAEAVLLPGAIWTADGRFTAPTAKGNTVRLWHAR